MDRRKLLQHYLPNPDELWRCLDETHTVVGGIAALLFLLRSASALPSTLDVYVSSLHSDRLEQLLEEDLHLFLSDIEQNTDHLGHLVSRAATFTISATRFITIHTSQSVSSLEPIAITPVTALANWVSPHAFACGYPSLTLRRRCIGAPPTGVHRNLIPIYHALRHLQFEIASEPTHWQEYQARVPLPTTTSLHACLRQLYLCPSQGRFFGDPGSLLTVFDILGADHNIMRERHQLPYGISIAWRLSTTHRSCDGPCSERDPILPENFLTLPTVMIGLDFQFRVMY
ncbi:hypothetical protein VTO73DRAFT_7950 [Trametes versicolor]